MICQDTFRVLQIDSQLGLDQSASRINALSEPLAKAGVSILYLSTYQTDYIFFKEKRLPLVTATLQGLDFEFVDMSEPDELVNLDFTRIPSLHVQADLCYPSLGSILPKLSNGHCEPQASPGREFPTDSGQPSESTAVGTDSELESPTSTESPDSELLASGHGHGLGQPRHRDQTNGGSRQGYASPKFVDVEALPKKVLPNYHLRLVGLRIDEIELWAMAMTETLFYATDDQGLGSSSRFLSYTHATDGISLVADDNVLSKFESDWLLTTTASPLICIQVDLAQLGLDRYGIVYSMSKPISQVGINMLLLSTFKTSNVLVEETDLPQVLHILKASSQSSLNLTEDADLDVDS
ncbi:uncharacterized protein BJ171DRAFT_31420 [Polychytrium aggregatum]|uniref:uncharacterized protein n=1 Tax=Polychytrium aggregatum TaxID=110093 RepID=UPI0022FE8033|nr:uncharacterized protein BJ171DRAFT_31420 [Polychytrium aggregatum]KAI9206482.1 hypothetical protein BJ171DRAFT_31420 [Polychytrium aggregatum]